MLYDKKQYVMGLVLFLISVWGNAFGSPKFLHLLEENISEQNQEPMIGPSYSELGSVKQGAENHNNPNVLQLSHEEIGQTNDEILQYCVNNFAFRTNEIEHLVAISNDFKNSLERRIFFRVYKINPKAREYISEILFSRMYTANIHTKLQNNNIDTEKFKKDLLDAVCKTFSEAKWYDIGTFNGSKIFIPFDIENLWLEPYKEHKSCADISLDLAFKEKIWKECSVYPKNDRVKSDFFDFLDTEYGFRISQWMWSHLTTRIYEALKFKTTEDLIELKKYQKSIKFEFDTLLLYKDFFWKIWKNANETIHIQATFEDFWFYLSNISTPYCIIKMHVNSNNVSDVIETILQARNESEKKSDCKNLPRDENPPYKEIFKMEQNDNTSNLENKCLENKYDSNFYRNQPQDRIEPRQALRKRDQKRNDKGLD